MATAQDGSEERVKLPAEPTTRRGREAAKQARKHQKSTPPADFNTESTTTAGTPDDVERFTNDVSSFGESAYAFVSQHYAERNRFAESLGRYELAGFNTDLFAAEAGAGRFRFDIRTPGVNGCRKLLWLTVGPTWAARAKRQHPEAAPSSPPQPIQHTPATPASRAAEGDPAGFTALAVGMIEASQARADKLTELIIEKMDGKPAAASSTTPTTPEDALKNALGLHNAISEAARTMKGGGAPAGSSVPWERIIGVAAPLVEALAERLLTPKDNDEPQRPAGRRIAHRPAAKPAAPPPADTSADPMAAKWKALAPVLVAGSKDPDSDPAAFAHVAAAMVGDETLSAITTAGPEAAAWLMRNVPELAERPEWVDELISAAQEMYQDDQDGNPQEHDAPHARNGHIPAQPAREPLRAPSPT